MSARHAALTRRRAVLSGLVGAVATACATRPPARAGGRPAESSRPAPARAVPRALLEHLPAAGLRWLVTARLRDLFRDRDLVDALAPLLPPARLDDLAERTGIELRETPAAVVAGFDYGTLYAVEYAGATAEIERRFRATLLGPPRLIELSPTIRVQTGVAGAAVRSLVVVERRVIGVAFDDPTPAKIVAAYATGRLRAPVALRGAALSSLTPSLAEAPLAAFAAGPFDYLGTRGARGLIAEAFAFGLALTPRGERLELVAEIAGDFADGVGGAAARLGGVWGDLAESPTGRLLALQGAPAPPRTATAEDRARLEVSLSLPAFTKGLVDATVAEVWQVLGLPPPR
ncbi:MAG: hypothetical protein IT376_11260 [Polyangiaceae bacterium]|nr:hypothetical protein [Polyangiaceae bacterium]